MKTNIVPFVDVDDLNYGVFNHFTYIDVDSIFLESVEKQFAGKEFHIRYYLFSI